VIIGCCSDTHGLVPPPLLEAEVVLHAGDVYEFDKLVEPGVWEMTRALNTLLVRGNHDCTDPAGIFDGAHDISGRVVPLNAPGPGPRLWAVGIGMACETPTLCPGDPMLYGQCVRVLDEALRVMRDGDASIIVTHYPALTKARKARRRKKNPSNYCYYENVQLLAEALRPIAVVQGHVHRQAGRIEEEDGILYLWPGAEGKILEVADDYNIVLRDPEPPLFE
jgi:predicted phosphodiesterase